MGFKSLSLGDQKLFEEFLSFKPHELSVYTFINIYIWRFLFDIKWKIIDDNLCVFFQDQVGCFLYLAPLGQRLSQQAVEESFRLMDGFNKNSAISRVENIESQDARVLEKFGYRLLPKPGEYLCLRKSLCELKGNSFKSKRSAVNYFCKHYQFRFLEYSGGFKDDCLKLYKFWAKERSIANSDPVYRGMLKDGLVCLEAMFFDYENFGLKARMVEVSNKIKAFTAGFEINPETFCVLFEFADLSAKGLSQYIFRLFCRELKDYKYINIMDDSGLENLKIAKNSYRPLRIIPSFIANRHG